VVVIAEGALEKEMKIWLKKQQQQHKHHHLQLSEVEEEEKKKNDDDEEDDEEDDEDEDEDVECDQSGNAKLPPVGEWLKVWYDDDDDLESS